MPAKKMIDRPRPKSFRGHQLMVEFYDDGTALLKDPLRNYVAVAVVAIPPKVKRPSIELEALLARAVVAVADSYRQQYKHSRLYGITLLPGAELSKEEMDKGAGLTPEYRKRFLEYQTSAYRLPDERPDPKKRSRSRLDK